MAITLNKKLTDKQVEQLKKKYPNYKKTWKQLYGEELGTDDKITTKAQLVNAMQAIFTTSIVEGVDIGSVLASFQLSTSNKNLAEAEKIQKKKIYCKNNLLFFLQLQNLQFCFFFRKSQ